MIRHIRVTVTDAFSVADTDQTRTYEATMELFDDKVHALSSFGVPRTNPAVRAVQILRAFAEQVAP